MSKALPQGKSKRITDEAVKTAGRKPLIEAERKTQIGVGLKPAEIERLDQARAEQEAISGVVIEQSVYARSCILAHLVLLELVKQGEIASGVLTKIREHRAQEVQSAQVK